MRGTPPSLPEAARKKLSEIELHRLAAEDGMRACQSRINSLPGDKVDLQARLEAERDKQSHRHGVLHQLHSRVQQWLTQLPRGSVLEEAPPPAHKSNGDLSAAINSIRKEIAALHQLLASVKAAGLPVAYVKALAQDYVVSLMRQAAPHVAVVGDQLRVTYRGDMVAAGDTVALLAWIAPDAVLRALERAIDALPERADAMSVEQRKKRIAELEMALDQAERAEQARFIRHTQSASTYYRGWIRRLLLCWA
jgi:hypothetical protein